MESPYTVEGFALNNQVKLYGDVIQSETRLILLLLTMSRCQYEFEEIDMLSGDHMSDEFTKKFPSEEVPVLVDGVKTV